MRLPTQKASEIANLLPHAWRPNATVSERGSEDY